MSTTINTVYDLQAMSDNLSEDYVLGCDIDASCTTGWNSGAGFIPVSIFTGTFDGAGYTISGLYINCALASAGLFGIASSATIENVKLIGASITDSVAGDNAACSVGVLVGEVVAGTVEDCYVAGTVSGTADDTGAAGHTHANVGGLVGECFDGVATIQRCASHVNVTATAEGGARACGGGLVGIYSCSGATILNCYARGTVAAIQEAYSAEAGGLVGYHVTTGSIDNTYATGVVTGNDDVGGLVGRTDDTPTNTDSFWDTETSGQATSDGGTGHTTAWMKTKSNFTGAGWDFDTIWAIASTVNDGYPFLGHVDTFWTVHSYTLADIFDEKGRVPSEARVEAFRNDTHDPIPFETAYVDKNGTATFSYMPNDVDVSFLATWGGTTSTRKNRWFFRSIQEITDGGTGASDTYNAKINLGLQIGVHVQQYSDDLTDIAALTPTDSNIIVGDGTDWVAESGNTARTSLGVGTGDSPQFTGVNVGHASDSTVTRVSAGLIAIEGDNLIRASDVDDTPVNGQTAVPVSSNWAYDHAATGVHSGMTWDAGVVSEELTYDMRIAFDLGTSTQRY